MSGGAACASQWNMTPLQCRGKFEECTSEVLNYMQKHHILAHSAWKLFDKGFIPINIFKTENHVALRLLSSFAVMC